MKRFDKKGMLVIPNPQELNPMYKEEHLLLVEKCYCPNGHNLINDHAIFNGFKGIVFMAKKSRQKGLVAISPVYGCKSRVAFDIVLKDNDIWKFCCPECKVELPVYTICECGADLTTFFTTKDCDYTYSVGICNRVGCQHANIHSGKDLLFQSTQGTY